MDEKMQAKEVLSQVKSAIDDLFVAKLIESEEGLEMYFLNGQKFSITIKEE